jgi:hypothetical protein
MVESRSSLRKDWVPLKPGGVKLSAMFGSLTKEIVI